MGKAIVKQPNGKWALWSTVVDDFVLINETKESILEIIGNDAKRRAIEDWERTFEQYDLRKCGAGIKAWGEALESVKRVHGEETVLENIKLNEEGEDKDA